MSRWLEHMDLIQTDRQTSNIIDWIKEVAKKCHRWKGYHAIVVSLAIKMTSTPYNTTS